MIEGIISSLQAACQELFDVRVEPDITRPDEQFGDYTTNVALQLAKQLDKDPRDIATTLAEQLKQRLSDLSEVTVAGPGFLNMTLSDQALWQAIEVKPAKALEGKTVVVELSSPNPFKDFHIGHVYNNVVGNALANLQAAGGATVHRVSYHGDVGMHIAMAVWAIVQKTGGQVEQLDTIVKVDRPKYLGEAYATGATAFKDDNAAQADIKAINAKIYDQSDPTVNRIYETGKAWSFAYFDSIYVRLGSQIEKKYYESESGPRGIELVREHLNDGIFEQSNGAVIYRGEKAGLHTRVFINAQGLPTYEAKDLGLTMLKWDDYHYDQSIIVTANEINEYFRVVLAALAEIDAPLSAKTTHLSHGLIKLLSGKMSSRTGNILSATQVFDIVEQAAKAAAPESDNLTDTTFGAIKYAFLKQRVGGDIVFEVEDSVALEGNSGPYLQYAHARACSILQKAGGEVPQMATKAFEPSERSLVRKLSEYSEVVDRAVSELMPHHICTYLYELAQIFNRFYEHNRVIGDERQALRLSLVSRYANTLQTGLELLGIAAPDKM